METLDLIGTTHKFKIADRTYHVHRRFTNGQVDAVKIFRYTGLLDDLPIHQIASFRIQK